MDYTAANLANVLNSQPIAGWSKAYGLDQTIIGLVGGFKPKAGRFQWTIKTDQNSTAGPFTSSTTLTSGDTQGRAKVTADPKRYGVRIAIDGLDEALAHGGAFDNIEDYVMDEVEGGLEDLFNQVETDICVTNSTTGYLNSIPNVVAFASASGNYYDIARSGNSYTNPCTVSASDGEKLQLSHLDDAHEQLVSDRKVKYDVVLMSIPNLRQYESILVESRSFTGYKDVSIHDAHFKGLEYEGRPVVGVPGLADTEVYFGNSNDMEIWYLPQQYTDPTTGQTKNDGMFRVEKMAKTTDSDVFLVKMYINLIIKNPYRSAVIGNLTKP